MTDSVLYEKRLEFFNCIVRPELTIHPHLHHEIELIYANEGEAVAYVDNQVVPIRTGSLFYCFPNQLHYYSTTRPGRFSILVVNPEILYELKELCLTHMPTGHILDGENDREEEALIAQIAASDGPYRNTRIVGLINLLFASFLPKITLTRSEKADRSLPKAVVKYCMEHYRESISLEEVANELHFSKYYLSHLFRSRFNITFHAYISQLRINAACAQLRNSNMRIADIANSCGFGSIRSLNREFSKILNMSPREYRNTVDKDKIAIKNNNLIEQI